MKYLVEIERVPHCENDEGVECGYGYYMFTCPVCNLRQQSFDIWDVLEFERPYNRYCTCDDCLSEFDIPIKHANPLELTLTRAPKPGYIRHEDRPEKR